MTAQDDLHPLNMIRSAPLAASTKAKYMAVLRDYLLTGHELIDAEALRAFTSTLSLSRQAHLSAAVRLWTSYMVNYVKSHMTTLTADRDRVTIARLEAIHSAVEARRPEGQKAHTWLTAEQVEQLFAAVPDTPAGERDRVALGVMVGAGLRREEATALAFDDILAQPTPGGVRAVLSIKGKGGKQRSVPISDDLRRLLYTWGERWGYQGRVLRSLDGDGFGESISGVALFDIVRKYGTAIGMPRLAPHDLRRTYAQLGYTNGVPLPQLSILLGHADIKTTMTYLNIKLDLDMTASDFVPIF